MKIHSIFSSINGEVSALGQGSLCTFIRLQGCNLRCIYCDTKKAQNEKAGTNLSEKIIYKKVQKLGIKNITITGGEPFLQNDDLLNLVKILEDYTISIETNGSLSIPRWGGFVQSIIADWKLPSSGMSHLMHIDNFQNLESRDYIKFVVANKKDFDVAILTIQKFLKLSERLYLQVPKFAFSPLKTKNAFSNKELLVHWMLHSKICKKVNAIYNLQLHKIINVL